MKAVLCKAYGGPETLTIEEIDAPDPKENEVLVDVHAAGVNFPDLLIIENKYQVKPPLPFSPGSEVAGIVRAVGTGVTHVKPGDKVFGSCTYNGFREQSIVPAPLCALIPAGMDFHMAAGFGLVYSTSYLGLKLCAALQAGETLLVMGAAGGIGLSAVELGKVMGARVIAAASTEEKLHLCRAYGVDETLLYPARMDKDQQKAFSEAIKEKTGGQGADVIYDPIGDKYTEPALRAITWRGRYLVVGFAAGDIPQIPLNLLLLKGCAVMGVFCGRFRRTEPQAYAELLAEISEFYVKGQLRPHISGVYPLDKAADALAVIAARKAVGKLIIDMGRSS